MRLSPSTRASVAPSLYSQAGCTSATTPSAWQRSRFRCEGAAELVLAGQVFQAFDDLLAGAVRVEAAGHVDADRQLLILEQVEVQVQRPAVGVAVGDAGEAVGVVEVEEFLDRLAAGSSL